MAPSLNFWLFLVTLDVTGNCRLHLHLAKEQKIAQRFKAMICLGKTHTCSYALDLA